MGYEIKDSGTRTEFAGGMVRDADAGNKTDYTSVMFGPMLERWAVHCTKGRIKYPDSEPGIPNWTLASSIEEWLHARGSLLRHLMAFLRGEQDEDHAAAIMFNVNVMEYTRERIGYAPDVFITAPVSEDNAGPEEEWGTPVALSAEPFRPFPAGPIPAESFDADGNYIPGSSNPEPDPDEYPADFERAYDEGMEKRLSEQAIDAAVASRAVGVATPVDARPAQTGYDSLFDGDQMLDFANESDFQWCYNASPPRAGHVWQCERPEGHAGDHAWNPLRNGWTREWAEDKVTRWADQHLTLVPNEEELPDE